MKIEIKFIKVFLFMPKFIKLLRFGMSFVLIKLGSQIKIYNFEKIFNLLLYKNRINIEI